MLTLWIGVEIDYKDNSDGLSGLQIWRDPYQGHWHPLRWHAAEPREDRPSTIAFPPPRYAPFINQFWTSPEVLSIISSIAGVDFARVMDYEICHTNVQLGTRGVEALKDIPAESEKVGFMNQKGGDGEGGERAWFRVTEIRTLLFVLLCSRMLNS